jgi:hypothetical protein
MSCKISWGKTHYGICNLTSETDTALPEQKVEHSGGNSILEDKFKVISNTTKNVLYKETRE